MKDNVLFPEFNESMDFKNLTGEQIKEAKKETISHVEEIIQEITDGKKEQRTYTNTLKRFDDLINELERVHSSIFLMAYVHPQAGIRKESLNSIKELSTVENRIKMDVGLYQAIKEYAQTEEAANLEEPAKKFLEDTIRDFEQNGLGLPKEKREQIKKIQDDISELGIQFESNITSYQDALIVGEKEMEGLPEDYKQARKTEDGNYKIDLTYPSYFPFMKYSESDWARKELSRKFKNIASDKNPEVLVKLLKKRKVLSRLLGYETYAAYILENRMAKDPSTVWDFEQTLREKVNNKAREDYEKLLEKKKQKTEGNPQKIEAWEATYYKTLLLREDYQLDDEQVKQYFELDRVIGGLFDVAGKLFGLEFREVENPSVWHEDVRLFEVHSDGQLRGRFYLDLFPRDNKFNHAACFTIIPGKETEKGYQKPTATLVTNFPRPAKQSPALLPHSDVVTLFHEFGHLMHDLLTIAPLSAQSGTSTKRDFVEVPSQLLEHWAWEYESLNKFAKHYQTGDNLPEALHQKMVDTKNVDSGLFILQQIFYAMLDMTFHERYNPDNDTRSTTEIVKELQNNITLFDYMENTHFEAGFGHLYGYAAGYYGYMWAKVYAEDMFSLFRKNGNFNAQWGEKLKKDVLEKGASREESRMVRDFLGREPGYDAFMKSMGIK
ncbi:MAG: Zn-dependent oligopeptidase [Bacteroidales bacterium]|nr:Zn-dependent oligopeptidase [Bacteroidales bacterium]